MFEEILREIQAHDTIILHRHHHPDGDALGSQIGLRYLLNRNYPDKSVFIVGDAPGRYSFMQGSVMDEVPDEAYASALAILLDTATPSLDSDERYRLAHRTARIDHHLYVETFTDVEVIDSSFESRAVPLSCEGASWTDEQGVAYALDQLRLSPRRFKCMGIRNGTCGMGDRNRRRRRFKGSSGCC